MKKFLMLLFVLFFTTLHSFAYELPRWQFFPISTAITEHEKAPIIKKAFSEWETRTGMAKFLYVNPVKRRPSITVKLVDGSSPYSEGGYTTVETFGQAYSDIIGLSQTERNFQDGFYTKATITIYLKYPHSDVRMNDDEIYEVALHQIGHALGLKHSSNSREIMFPDITGVTHLTSDDIKAFNKIYKP